MAIICVASQLFLIMFLLDKSMGQKHLLFALPGYQFPYIVMNRCLYLIIRHLDRMMQLFLSTEFPTVNLPRYYDYDTRNMTFF
jgi:hypothetical protein